MSSDCTYDAADAAARLEAALVDADGYARNIGRVELEVLGPGTVRWTLYGGQPYQRLHSLTGSPGDVAGFCAATQILLEQQIGGEHVQTDQGP